MDECLRLGRGQVHLASRRVLPDRRAAEHTRPRRQVSQFRREILYANRAILYYLIFDELRKASGEAQATKLLSAAIYPLMLAAAGSVAVTVLIFFVLPRFVTLLEGSGAKLPASTAEAPRR